jgi:Protein of unknown function (DUF2652)/Polyketide cyclase / dehydrase and lipid transport
VTDVRRGCLLLADISGYTRYLSGVELEHSHDVLADLLGVVANELVAAGRLAKLEGDAVFICDTAGLTDGETLLATLDAAYFAFATRRRTIDVRTTCQCEACARIGSLDLKLIAHHGSFVEHVVAESREVVGPDVITVHRLLKNTVAERTGVQAFALVTDVCAEALGIDAEALGLTAHEEEYDDVGTVAGWVRDLAARWRESEQRAPVRIAPADANFSAEGECPALPSAVWEQLVDPARLMAWKEGITAAEIRDPAGGRGVGSVTHCVHGRKAFDQEILDWRPFTYFSYRELGPYGPFLWTFELADQDGSTSVKIRVKLIGGIRQRLIMTLGRRSFQRLLETNLANLADVTAKATAPPPHSVA